MADEYYCVKCRQYRLCKYDDVDGVSCTTCGLSNEVVSDEPDYRLPGNAIYEGDCLDVMRRLQEFSVDVIITSPPYADARKDTYGGMPPDKYVEWWSERVKWMKYVLKPEGSILVNIKEKAVDGQLSLYVMDLIYDMVKTHNLRLVDKYIWHKTAAFPGRWNNRFRNAWEYILHFTQNKRFKMRQDAVKVPAAESTKRRGKNLGLTDMVRQKSGTRSGMDRNVSRCVGNEMVYPSNVLTFSPVTHNTGHSAAFPRDLPDFFIRLFSDEGDMVLDPFCGSGTTCVVARDLNRQYLGIEMNPEYYKLATNNMKGRPEPKLSTFNE